MHIQFAPADEQYIKDSVKNGIFPTEEDAVRYAVRFAREQMEAKRNSLLAALQAGEDDIAAGRTVPYTRELMQKLCTEAVRMTKTGEKRVYDPNVIP